MTSVMVVDDDQDLAEMLGIVLNGVGIEVDLVSRGDEAVDVFRNNPPDLVLLDIMLPGLDGIEVCKQIRKQSMRVPIVMLTAKSDTHDIVKGLEAGADDYMVKPFKPSELVARIRAVLRRNSDLGEDVADSGILTVGPIRLDSERHVISINGTTAQFPLKEFELLEFLMRNSGRVLTRTQLIDRVWGSDYVGDTKTLDVHIKRLRAKIEEDPANPVYIQTVRGLGYKMESK